MGQIGRPGLSDDKQVERWTLSKAGESFPAIARVLGKPVGSIDGVVRLRGGMVPRIRKRADRALTRGDREAISCGQLNTRPRKTLGFRTPAAILAERVALTG